MYTIAYIHRHSDAIDYAFAVREGYGIDGKSHFYAEIIDAESVNSLRESRENKSSPVQFFVYFAVSNLRE